MSVCMENKHASNRLPTTSAQCITNIDLDFKVLITVPNKGFQSTNNIAQVAKSLVSRSIVSCFCTPAKYPPKKWQQDFLRSACTFFETKLSNFPS